MSEKIYQFNEYVLGYDKGENDRSCLVISKYLLDKVYVMAELYDGSAEIISTILDSLQKENKQLKKKYENAVSDYEQEHYKVVKAMLFIKDNICGGSISNAYELLEILGVENE